MGYVVFERIRGRSLVAMAAAEERMPLPRAISAMGELCDAIAELHRAGLAHGDLSPANVILDSLGRLRLVDYGLAQPITPERAAVDVARAGALLQWLMLGHVPRGPGPGADHAPGWRGRMVQAGWECRERPGTALGLAVRLLRAEWSRERVVSWAVGAGVGVLFLAFGAISRLLF
jgi:serine/threonine protein kinase